MAKATELNADMLTTPQTTPLAATSPRVPSKTKALAPAEKPMPLQVRWPREDVKAVKLAAVYAEQTISEFMLACFHAYMRARK